MPQIYQNSFDPTYYENQHQAQPYIPQDPIYLAGQDPNIIRWQLEIEQYLERFEHYMYGHTRDYAKRTWKDIGDEADPKCNKQGVKDMISFLSNELDKTLTMSNLTMEDVYRLAREARRNIVELVYLNWKLWELYKRYWNDVVIKIDHIIFTNLLRAYNQGERNYHKAVQTYRETRVVNNNPQQKQQKSGLLSGF